MKKRAHSNHEAASPLVRDLKEQFDRGKMSRREFIRYATLLGVSVGAAMNLVGLGGVKKAFAAPVKRGGTLKVSAAVQKITHVAQINSIGPSNMLRQVGEYLTVTDKNNITHPYLLKSWKASEDLKTWTLNLRDNVTFNNGDAFTADDVVFTISMWLNKDVGSSFLGLVGKYLDPTGIEKVNPYQVKLHLKKSEIAVPEHLFHYPGIMVNHRTFEGDFLKNPHGTGPYTFETYNEGEICILKRRDDYWQKGADGKPLPYMDGIMFQDMGTEMAPQVAAISSGEIDSIDLGDAGGSDVVMALKDNPDITIQPISTAQLRVLRMRVDLKPFDDNRVRMALKLCQHREKILQLAYFGEGLPGQDIHVYPGHPEYCKKPIPKYDPELAKQLLKDAGYANGVEMEVAVANDWKDVVRYAEILKEDAAPAGIKLNINTMPVSQYWDLWTEVALGVTDWQHRPLGTMVYNLAYTGDENGNPVPWNETRWMDDEFDALLEKANGTLDVEERRKIFCKLEDIQMSRGSIGIPYSRNTWSVTRDRVKDIEPHPTNYMLTNKTWLDTKA